MAIANFVPEIWSSALLVRFAESEVVAGTVNRQYEGDATRGNTVNITSITTPTVVDYSVSRTITAQDLADTTQALLIDQEKAFSFNVDDVDRVQAAGSFEPVTRDAAAALVEDSETFILDRMKAQGTMTTGTSAGSTNILNAADAYDEVNKIRTAMRNAKVPAGDRFLVVNPDYAEFLLGADSKLSSVDTSGSPAGLRDAVIGRLLGFTVLESPLLTNANGPIAVGYHRSAVAYVNQIDKVEALRNQTKFADIVRALHVYGARVVRPTAVHGFQNGV